MPLSFMLPKGAISPAGFRRDDAFVDADDAVFERFGDAPDAADVAAVEIGGETEFGVVRHLDGLVLGLEAVERGDRAKSLLLGDDHVGRHIGQNGRLEKAAPLGGALAAGTTLAPFLTASAMCASTFSTAFMSIRGPITAPGSNPSATFIAPAVSARRLVKAS
jgi:hypothetical protein